MSLNSVERTTMIELFSTFFDRLIINHPNRDTMLKQLYQFKTHLYSNDSMKNYFEDLQHFANQIQPPKNYQTIEQKSPSKRDISQPRQKSIRKDEQPEILKSRHNKPIIDKNFILTSCHHEFEKMAFESYINSQLNEFGSAKCPQCQQLLPTSDYENFNQRNVHQFKIQENNFQAFEEFKNKTNQVLRVVQNIEKSTDEFISLVATIDSEDQNKQRCFSGAVEYYREQSPILSNLSSIGYSRLGEDKPMTLSNQSNLSMMKKCLRCNKDVGNKENKGQSSYFCLACRNL